MKKKIFVSICLLFSVMNFAQTKGLLISELLANPAGTDSPFEYVELVATTSINFVSTPYTVVFTNNGTATANGWIEGKLITYAFLINTGSVTAGQVVYVGGSSMLPLNNNGVAIRKISTGDTDGDNFGLKSTTGVFGNGGQNCDGVAVFSMAASSITSSTVPDDAIFFGTAVGGASKSSTEGYELPLNDKYNGGKLVSTSFISPDPASDVLVKATSGTYNSTSNTFTVIRTWATAAAASYNTTSITLASNTNSAPIITLDTPAVSGDAPATVDLSATASVTGGLIIKVEFFNGTQLIGTSVTSPYTYSWTNVPAGTYQISAKATDNNTATATSAIKTVTVTSAIPNLAPTLSFNSTASKFVDLASGVISAVKDNTTDPFIVTGLDINVDDDNLNSVTFSMTSSNTSVVSNTDFTVTGSGTARNFKINPTGVGYSTLTLKATDSQGLNASLTLNLAVSASLSTASTKEIYNTGVADGSTAIAIDANYMFVADDETNVIKLYSRNNSGLSLYQFDVNPFLNLGGTEVDIEASFRSTTNPNRIYWMGSLSNSKTGKDRPDRNRIFATDIVGTGANATLKFVGYYNNLRSNIITWGDLYGYNFTTKAAVGIEPKRIDGFNVEGLEMGPDGTTLFIAFRAPYVGTGNNKAVICPVLNFETWFGAGSPPINPILGTPIELNLNNHGIRSLGKNASNNFLIVAGSYAASGTFEMYSWNGLAASAPILLNLDLTNLKPEGIVEVPANISGSFSVDLISDLGSEIIYNDGIENKSVVQPNHRKFLTSTINANNTLNTNDFKNLDPKSSNSAPSLNVFPNPFTSLITINFSENCSFPSTLFVYNSNGMLSKKIFVASNMSRTVDFSDLNTGIYFVKSIEMEKGIKIIKI